MIRNSIVRLRGISLIAASVAACGGGAPPRPAPAAAPAAVPAAAEGHVTTGDGVRLFYQIRGGGARDTLVMIHGGPGITMDYFLDDLEPLARRHTLLFYDQRGTGRSSVVRDSAALAAARFADDLEAIRTHFGLERLTLLGHSWGAGPAALYAMRHPDRVARLIIVDGIPLRRSELVRTFDVLDAGRDSTTRAEMQRWYAARVADPGDVTACRAYYMLWFQPFFVDTSALSRSRGDFCAGTPESRRNKIEAVDRFTVASLGDWDWRPGLRAVTAPALIVHGSADPIPVATAREWAATLPNARLVILDGVGHFPYLEAPDRFVSEIDAFLRED